MPFLLAAAAVAAPAGAAERRLSVTDYDRVQVDGPYEVSLSTGGSSQATLLGDQAAIDRVSVEVQGRTLRIRPKAMPWGDGRGAASTPARIVLSTRNLTDATVAGAGSLAVDRVRGLKIDLAVSGSGSLTVGSVDADNLTLGLVGSGRLLVSGKAKSVRVFVSGTGDLDARALQAEDLVLSSGTSGRIAISATRKARVTAEGRGSVEVLGTSSCTVSGPAAGQVRCGKVN